MSKRKLRHINCSEIQSRTEGGTFAKICGCIMHQEWSSLSIYDVLNISTCKKYSQAVVKEM